MITRDLASVGSNVTHTHTLQEGTIINTVTETFLVHINRAVFLSWWDANHVGSQRSKTLYPICSTALLSVVVSTVLMPLACGIICVS